MLLISGMHFRKGDNVNDSDVADGYSGDSGNDDDDF